MANKRATLSKDESEVQAAIEHIQRIWRQGLLDAVVAVGDYLIRVAYSGDLALASSFRPTKPKLLEALYARSHQLPIKPHALKVAVRIAVQYHQLPRPLADGLSKSHHEALLPVPELKAKVQLAEFTLSRAWTA